MESITATASATGTAGVIKAAHAEVVATASITPVEIVVVHIPDFPFVVAPSSQEVPQRNVSSGFFYHYQVAPGELVNTV